MKIHGSKDSRRKTDHTACFSSLAAQLPLPALTLPPIPADKHTHTTTHALRLGAWSTHCSHQRVHATNIPPHLARPDTLPLLYRPNILPRGHGSHNSPIFSDTQSSRPNSPHDPRPFITPPTRQLIVQPWSPAAPRPHSRRAGVGKVCPCAPAGQDVRP